MKPTLIRHKFDNDWHSDIENQMVDGIAFMAWKGTMRQILQPIAAINRGIRNEAK